MYCDLTYLIEALTERTSENQPLGTSNDTTSGVEHSTLKVQLD